MAGGRARLRAMWKLMAGIGVWREKEATWARAWTPGVGAAGLWGRNGFSGDVMNGLGEEVPWTVVQSWLDLPAVEGGAVVGEDGFPDRHEDALDGITTGRIT